MSMTGDEARYQHCWGRYAHPGWIPYLSHLLATAEAYQTRVATRPVPVGSDGQPDPWIAGMRENNEREVNDLRRRLTELGATPGEGRLG